MTAKPQGGVSRRRVVVASALAAGLAGRAFAQGRYPTKPVTLIVPFAPGGIADITARTVAQAVGASLGQAFVIDNRPSAGSIVASQAVAKATPDGYTLLLMSNANAVSTGLFLKMLCGTTRSTPVELERGFQTSVAKENGNDDDPDSPARQGYGDPGWAVHELRARRQVVETDDE